jgi:predicted double-glycine peptidase
MKKILLLLLLFPLLTIAQIEKSIKLKVAVMQNFVSKGEEGEKMFWQTKGQITYGIVNYTEAQNFQFKDLFINQYKELEAIYKRMIVSEDERDTDLYIRTLIRQEDDYRKLLTAEQLKKYRDQLADFEKNNAQAHDSYSSLFFSDNLLKEFKTKFQYK